MACGRERGGNGLKGMDWRESNLVWVWGVGVERGVLKLVMA